MTLNRWHNLAMLFVAAIVLTILSQPTAAEDDLWTVSFEKAKAAASEEGKDILMEFTGSDWCPPCISLHKNVLSKDEFKTEAPKHFVLLKLDNPRDKSKQSDEEQAQYKKLSAQYQITGVPTIILADAQGRPFAKKVGYGGTEAAEYVASLTESTKAREKRDDFFAKAENAEGIEKAKLLAEALSLIDTELALTTYEDTVKQIIAADADNEAGLKSKYEGLYTLAKVKTELKTIQGSFDPNAPEASLAKVDELIKNLELEGESLQEALYLKGFIQYRTGDKETAKATLEAALKLAPDSDKGQQIASILESVFKPKEDEEKDDEKKE